MSAAQDAARLVALHNAHADAVETLVERVEAGTASVWDAKAVTTAFDAMDATRHALWRAHFPDARAVCVDGLTVIVRYSDDRVQLVPTEDDE